MEIDKHDQKSTTFHIWDYCWQLMQPPCRSPATQLCMLHLSAQQVQSIATLQKEHQENGSNAMPNTGIENKTRGHQLPKKNPINDRVDSKFFLTVGLPAPEPCVELTCSPAGLLAACLQSTRELLGVWRNQKMSVSVETSRRTAAPGCKTQSLRHGSIRQGFCIE